MAGKHSLDSEKKEKMQAILSDLKDRMREIDEMGKKIREGGTAPSPRRTQHLLEEIKVPPLKLLREKH